MPDNSTDSDSQRSPELMSRDDTTLLVVDIQERLIPAISNGPRVVWNAGRLIDGAKILGLSTIATEQYPQGLGATVKHLADRFAAEPETPISEKLSFSCRGCPAVNERLDSAARSKILVCGIEAHVCVQQTALDLLAAGYRVYVTADAVGSRHDMDCQMALSRMDSAGAILTTTEAALFEWCAIAGTPEFKAISRLVREPPHDALAKRSADS